MKKHINRFYKTSPHGNLGSNLVFWSKGSGYTTDLDKAEVYSFDEAQEEVSKGYLREGEYPLSADHIDALAVEKIDCQYINLKYPESKDCNGQYVAYKSDCWDGNDVSFITDTGNSFDYSRARVFVVDDIAKFDFDGFILIPKSHADQIKRKTFQWRNVNKRKMIQGVGIIGVRAKRKSRSTGKERHNCPSCGRINWQYNPYEFEGCSNVDCEKRKPSWERNYRGD